MRLSSRGIVVHVATLFVAVLTTAVLATSGSAAEDQVYFCDPQNDPIDTLLAGVQSAELMIVWGQNVTDWEIVLDHPLLEHGLDGMTMEHIDAGHRMRFGLDLNASVPAGDYIVPVRLRYTDDEGQAVDRTYELTLHYVRTVELRMFAIEGSTLVLEVELFMDCDRLTVEFDTDGDLSVAPERVVRRDLGPGVQRFEARLSRLGLGLSGDADEVGYDVRAMFGDREVQLFEKNIDPASVQSGGGVFGWAAWVAVAATLSLALVGALLFMRRRRRRRTARAVEAGSIPPPPHLRPPSS